MMSTEKVRVRIRVYGLVQGVGFRAYTLINARRLGLKGYVRNLPDGSVEIVAEGPRTQVELLVDMVRQGPPAAIVRRIDVMYEKYQGAFEDFYILH